MQAGENYVLSKARGLTNSESGQDLIEYAMLAGLFSLAVVAISQTIASILNTLISNLNNNLF